MRRRRGAAEGEGGLVGGVEGRGAFAHGRKVSIARDLGVAGCVGCAAVFGVVGRRESRGLRCERGCRGERACGGEEVAARGHFFTAAFSSIVSTWKSVSP